MEDVEPDATEALRFFRQAAELAFSDAHIRIGEFYRKRCLRATFWEWSRSVKFADPAAGL